MVKKIVVSHFNNIAAILQNNKIQEIILVNDAYQVNDIYIGIVQKIFSSINAAFVKLGKHGKSGFIHISDIKPLKKGRRTNHIAEILSINQVILVQVIKEPTVNKGPRLTANINLVGKYIILMPFCNTICISHKIYDQNERNYLYSLALLLKPVMMGLLIRPSAEGTQEDAIIEDLEHLKKQWSFIEKAMISSSHPKLLYKDEDLVKKIVRDFYEENIRKIIIDSESGLNQLNYHLHQWYGESCAINTKLQLYNKPECILEQFNIKQAMSRALKPKVKLASGGHIIIESNEALTVIDVNSGSFNKSDNSKEAILRTNFSAAIEIAYQLKIRNINGLIVIDFIDMQSQRDQLQLLDHFSRCLYLDNAKPQIVQLSELGLVELTRRRRGQSLQELFQSQNQPSYYSQQSFGIKPANSIMDANQSHDFLFHKNINTLFFKKKFKKNLTLEFKQFQPKHKFACKYFLYFDRVNTINLFKPKANCIVPLLLYSKLIGHSHK
uniref:Ribonuclease E-like protein n=1 Tax=Grateloupia filicina TaxID=31455 RepID=A0A2S1FWY2_9FLOR|nr:ribonuclease E-like protein [Grateloupia filicina]AWD77275.1 ribonuclease E-like protein [Grateloupia filicina]